jgi:hypothetical protein
MSESRPTFRFSLLVLMVMLMMQGTLSVPEVCDAYCPEYPMEQSLKKFRDAVDDMYSGQEDAIAGVSKALMANMIANNNLQKAKSPGTVRMKPLLLHFTG